MKRLLSGIEDPGVRNALSASVRDAVLWAVMFGTAENYVLPFAIFFGANAVLTSLIQGSGQMAVAIGQLMGASWVQKHGNRRNLAMLCNFLHACSWLLILGGAILFQSPWAVLAGYTVGLLATSFAGPGWLSWMNDLVPVSIRGVYWGKRNQVAGLWQFAAILIAGLFLGWAEPLDFTLPAFAILFCIAFTVRAGSVLVLRNQYEPPMEKPEDGISFRFGSFLSSLHKEPFGRFVIFSVLSTMAVNLMNPIIPVFLLNSLGLDYVSFMLVTMSLMVMSFVAMSYWGPLTDRFGNYRILVTTAVVLPLIAFALAVVKVVWALVLVQLIGGFVWAGFNLSTTNFIFDSVSRGRMAKVMAYFNGLNNIAAFSGSILGGILAALVQTLDLSALGWTAPGNYELIFVLSGLLRAGIAVMLIRTFREVRPVESSPNLAYFYIYQPFTIFLNRFQFFASIIVDKIKRK